MAPLKNYTTEVPAVRSIGQIQEKLVSAGARAILVDYDDNREPVAVAFTARTRLATGSPEVDVSFRLPCRVSAVRKILEEGRGPRSKPVKPEQAARVAWRIVKDWIEVQIAMLEIGQAELAELFLPYVTTPRGDTVYQRLTSGPRAPLLQLTAPEPKAGP